MEKIDRKICYEKDEVEVSTNKEIEKWREMEVFWSFGCLKFEF